MYPTRTVTAPLARHAMAFVLAGGRGSRLMELTDRRRLFQDPLHPYTRALLSVAPVPDQRLYDTIYQERYMGLPAENPKGYAESAIHYAQGLQGRLLLIHGTGDDNVHIQGTERLVNKLIESGKPVDMMVYPNRSHFLTEGKGTMVHQHMTMGRYFYEHLKPE